MQRSNNREMTYEQISDLVNQLEFEKQMALINAIIREKEYREIVYRYLDDVRKKHTTPMFTEELNAFPQED